MRKAKFSNPAVSAIPSDHLPRMRLGLLVSKSIFLGLVGATTALADDEAGARHAIAPIESTKAPSPVDLKDPEWIKAGKTKFVQTCAYCHGTQGEAGKTQSFKTRRNWDPQVIHDTISNGRVNGPNVMPSWRGSIQDDVIWKVVAYIKSLSAENDSMPGE